MIELVKKVKSDLSIHCLTISFNTHRTAPDRYKDEILMKNLVKEAEEAIAKRTGNKKETQLVIDNLKKCVSKIDFSRNLDSLILFASENQAECITLPIRVTERVSVCDNFIIRDLVRAIYAESSYYVYMLSMKEVDLIEALNDRPVKFYGTPFPILNDDSFYVPEDSRKERNLKDNFLNLVDKQLNDAIRQNDLPVVVCADEAIYHDYLKVADRPERFIGSFNFDYKNLKNIDLHVVEAAWPIMQQYNKEKEQIAVSDIKRAIRENKCVSDLTKIYYGSKKGEGTLYVKKGYYLPARLENGIVIPIKSEVGRSGLGVIDDIISECILNMIAKGGKVVFLQGDLLDLFGGIALASNS